MWLMSFGMAMFRPGWISSSGQRIRLCFSSYGLLRIRPNSAAFVHEFLNSCREDIPGRPRIEFASSGEMTEELRAAIKALPEEAWKPPRKINKKEMIAGRKEWAEVEFSPRNLLEKKDETRPLPRHPKPSGPGRTLSGWKARALLCRLHQHDELE